MHSFFWVINCALLSYLIHLPFSYNTFFLYILFYESTNHLFLFIFTQPASNSFCYLRVVF